MTERHRANGRHRRRSRSASQPLFAVGAVAAAFAVPGMSAGGDSPATPGSDALAATSTVTPMSAETKQAALRVLAAQAKLQPGKGKLQALEASRASRSQGRAAVVDRSATRASSPASATKAAVKAPTATVRKSTAKAVVPVVGYRLTAEFGQAGRYWSSGYHTGQDFSIRSGTTVRAAAAGRVVESGWAGSYGYRIVIQHSDGRYTTYSHLSKRLVFVGKSVSMGQSIALSGSTGNSTGPHLHFEVLNSEKTPIGPMTWLRSRGVKV